MARLVFPDKIRIASKDNMDAAGRHILLYWLGRMQHHEQQLLRQWDVDALHDLRVATRRMRVACRLFGPFLGKKKLSPINAQLRLLGRSLGAVRDLDVLLEFIEDYAKEYGETPGLKALQRHLTGIRKAPRKDLMRYLHKKSYNGFKRDFQSWLFSKSGKKKKRAGKKKVAVVAPGLLDAVREDVLAYAPLITEDTSVETLHELRIACKKLRYTAESFSSCYKKRLLPVIRLATAIQGTLGRYHDADVHIDYLNNFITHLDRRSSRERRFQANLEEVIASEKRMYNVCLSDFHTVWPQAIEHFTATDFSL